MMHPSKKEEKIYASEKVKNRHFIDILKLQIKRNQQTRFSNTQRIFLFYFVVHHTLYASVVTRPLGLVTLTPRALALAMMSTRLREETA